MTRNLRGLGLIAREDATGALSYYLNNAHGDVTSIVNGAGEVLNAYEYDAFGNTTKHSEQIFNRFRYAGEQFDNGTGQYYLRARYYNPRDGRFTQEDTYRGDGLNLYAYVGNNPIRYIDPSGYWKCNSQEDAQKLYLNLNEPTWLNKELKAAYEHYTKAINGETGLLPIPYKNTIRPILEAIQEAIDMGALEQGSDYHKALLIYAYADAFNFESQLYLQHTYAAMHVDNARGYMLQNIMNKVMNEAMKNLSGPNNIPRNTAGSKGFKTLDELGLKNGSKMSADDILDAADEFLGKGYIDKGKGRYVSKDGTRVFRMGDNDLLGKHADGPHVNFETLIPNPDKPGKMMVDIDIHIYIK